MKDNNSKRVAIIFTIIFAIISTIYVYTNKQNSVETIISDFKVSNFSYSFGEKDKVESGNFIDEVIQGENYEPTINYNVPYLKIHAYLKNGSGEKIESASVFPKLIITFKSSQKNIKLREHNFYSLWQNGETLEINEKFLLTYSSDFEKEFLKHTPEKVELELYIVAKNSVGYNKEEVIFRNEINSWKPQ